MTYESLSSLLMYLLAAPPAKDGWDIAEVVGSVLTTFAALVVAGTAFWGLRSWHKQTLYERRLNVASDFMKGVHNVRIGFLGMTTLTTELLAGEPEDPIRTRRIETMSNELAKPIRICIVEMRSISVQAEILGMPEFARPMESLFKVSDKYLKVLNTAISLRNSEPMDAEKLRLLEEMIKQSGYFERLGVHPNDDPLDQDIVKIEDEALAICKSYLKPRTLPFKLR